MMALVELVDEFGEAIESDLSALHGDSLRDYLTGRRPAGEALRKINMLPPSSATGAQMQAKPQSGPSRAPEPWRRFYGVTPTTHALWDLWDLQSQRANAGSKKKAATHPRTSDKRAGAARGRPNAAMPPSRRGT